MVPTSGIDVSHAPEQSQEAAMPSGADCLGVFPLPHSHLAIRHLIRQLEIRGRSPRPHTPPEWLKDLLHQAADFFDPCSGDARAGYECRQTPNGWEAAIFLGANECVGGRDDGRIQPANFRFDVRALLERFDRTESVTWSAFPESDAATPSDRSFLTVTGIVGSERVTLQICAGPPESCGPAMKIYSDGRYELC
jgi:hypothetical protein